MEKVASGCLIIYGVLPKIVDMVFFISRFCKNVFEAALVFWA